MEDVVNSIIWSTHEEHYSDGRTLGIVTNFDLDENMKRINSFAYIFRQTDQGGMYIFFETIVDMNDYMLYSDKRVKRAYMKEDNFDKIYDNDIKGIFEDKLEWM